MFLIPTHEVLVESSRGPYMVQKEPLSGGGTQRGEKGAVIGGREGHPRAESAAWATLLALALASHCRVTSSSIQSIVEIPQEESINPAEEEEEKKRKRRNQELTSIAVATPTQFNHQQFLVSNLFLLFTCPLDVDRTDRGLWRNSSPWTFLTNL
uniref:Uncharacterized protein n=1 Tax=Physcomitrium patens TaxID=3218 RepID=A0A7I3Z1W8_PHYPA